MKRITLFVQLILAPILIVIVINESSRILATKPAYTPNSIPSLNSSNSYENKCSWKCHDSTQFCKDHHFICTQEQIDLVDPIYFGIINGLKSTGKYKLANVLILVIIIPLGITFLFWKSILMQFEIQKLKHQWKES